MELSTTALVGFRTRYESIFNQAFNLVKPKIEKAALRVDSGRVELVNHRWLRGMPGMREFVDARVINNVSTDGLIVKNRLWEDTIGIPRVDIERDLHKVYDPLIARTGQAAALHRDKLGFELLSDMLTNTAITSYDGIAFYGNHNSNRAVSFNNKASGVLNSANLQLAIAALRNRRDSAGNPLAAIESKPLLWVHPSNSFVAEQLANQSFFPITQPGTGASSSSSQAAAGENILKGAFEWDSSPYLKTTTEWHVMLVDPYFKALIWQVEQDIEFLDFTKFLYQWSMLDQFTFGVRALYNAAPGLPEMTYGSTGTV